MTLTQKQQIFMKSRDEKIKKYNHRINELQLKINKIKQTAKPCKISFNIKGRQAYLQRKILIMLKNEPLTTDQMTKDLGLLLPSISRAIGKMIDKGLIKIKGKKQYVRSTKGSKRFFVLTNLGKNTVKICTGVVKP